MCDYNFGCLPPGYSNSHRNPTHSLLAFDIVRGCLKRARNSFFTEVWNVSKLEMLIIYALIWATLLFLSVKINFLPLKLSTCSKVGEILIDSALMGFWACGVRPSGVFRVWALYLDLGKKTLHENKMSWLFCNKLGRKLCLKDINNVSCNPTSLNSYQTISEVWCMWKESQISRHPTSFLSLS